MLLSQPPPASMRDRSRDRLTPRLVSTTLLSLARLRLRPNKRFVHGLLLSLQPTSLSTAAGRAETVQLGMALPVCSLITVRVTKELDQRASREVERQHGLG